MGGTEWSLILGMSWGLEGLWALIPSWVGVGGGGGNGV